MFPNGSCPREQGLAELLISSKVNVGSCTYRRYAPNQARKFVDAFKETKFEEGSSLRQELDDLSIVLVIDLHLQPKEKVKAVKDKFETDTTLKLHKGMTLLPLGRHICAKVDAMLLRLLTDEGMVSELKVWRSMWEAIQIPTPNDMITLSGVRLQNEPAWRDFVAKQRQLLSKASPEFVGQYSKDFEYAARLIDELCHGALKAYDMQFYRVIEVHVFNLVTLLGQREMVNDDPDELLSKITSVTDKLTNCLTQLESWHKGFMPTICAKDSQRLVELEKGFHERADMITAVIDSAPWLAKDNYHLDMISAQTLSETLHMIKNASESGSKLALLIEGDLKKKALHTYEEVWKGAGTFIEHLLNCQKNLKLVGLGEESSHVTLREYQTLARETWGFRLGCQIS